MEAVTPVVTGYEEFEVVYAKNQPEYNPLPVLRTDKILVTRWKLTEEERKHIAEGGDLFVAVMHFGQLLQPVKPIAAPEDEVMRFFVESGAPL